MTEFVAVESRNPPRLSKPVVAGHMDSANYIPVDGLAEAADSAMLLGIPLLLTGEPGTGKTRAAYWLASEIGVSVQRFDTKSTTTGRDLLYTFDEIARFRDASQNQLRPMADYVTFGALGKAILCAAGGEAVLTDLAGDALERDHFSDSAELIEKAFGEGLASANTARVKDLACSDATLQVGQSEHCLVLVDELDKAPRDAPNDLLAEIENMGFAIPELGIAVDSGDEFRPIVIITSNSEKSLPEPFLRRCACFDIPFPPADTLEEIIVASVAAVSSKTPLVESAIAIVEKLRESHQIRKRPGTSELLAWIEVLIRKHKIAPETSLYDALAKDPGALDTSLSAVLKSGEDIREGTKILQQSAHGA